ncbi:MAG TPA: hypothetical protein VFZ53_23725 [Polyangiaceae bacterium]
MRENALGFAALCSLLALRCGGGTPPPEEPANAAPPAETVSEAPKPEPEPADAEPPKEKPAADVPEPEFKENGSVEEAIKAVPQGTPRLNVETEALSKPLMDGKVYEPCKLGAAKFKVRVAVWNGKAVGIDLTTTPNNPKLAECLKGRIREITWDDKVKSLNTVEYQF